MVKLVGVALLVASGIVVVRVVRAAREVRERWDDVTPVPVPNVGAHPDLPA